MLEKEIAEKVRSLSELEEKRKLLKEVALNHRDETALERDAAEIESLTAEIKTLSAEIEEVKRSEPKENKNKEIKRYMEKNIEKSIEEKRESRAYARVFAKHYLGRAMGESELALFNEVNNRAEGVATTTTATSYVAPTSDVDGVNNGGVFIPTSISLGIIEELQKTSPFFARITRIAVTGGVNFPYSESNSGAKWYAEGTATEDQSMKFNTLVLSGYELAKFIKITWKLENMSVDGFLAYIQRELTQQCGKALVKAVLYGTGGTHNQPTGATVGALKSTTAGYTDALDELKKAPAKLIASGREDAIIGAEYFVSHALMDEITFAADDNGRYQFNALVAPTTFGSYKITVDPYLDAGDGIFGNPGNYILNEQVPLGTLKESDAKFRRNNYSAYAIYDGRPIPKTFVYITKAD